MADEFPSRPESPEYLALNHCGDAEEIPMVTRRLERAFGPTGAVPATRTVADLDAALGLVRRLGGSIVSETRAVPGIGSWAFVSDTDGRELLLWQSSIAVGG
jgi:predicted enzyme related to lactoylglutathione lyase